MASNMVSPDAVVDLQLHTHHSDGAWTPEALIEHLAREGFAAAAITDHDSMEHVGAHQRIAAVCGVILLPAVEMTTEWRGEMVDVLCFGGEVTGSPLSVLCLDVMRRQQDNTREVVANLIREGVRFPDDPAALDAIINTPSAEQPHAFVRWFKDLGYGTEERSAGRMCVDAGIKLVMTDIAAVVDAAHQSGAVVILAHGGRGDGYPVFDADLLDQLRADAPMDGIEAHYPKHSAEQTALYVDYARQHGLLISAGSDSHSLDNPPIKYPASLCRDLLERLGVSFL